MTVAQHLSGTESEQILNVGPVVHKLIFKVSIFRRNPSV